MKELQSIFNVTGEVSFLCST